MIMKKLLYVLICTVLLLLNLCVCAEAESDTDLYYNEFKEVYEAIPDDVKKLLNESGLGEFEFESFFEISFRDIWTIILKIMRGQLESPLTALIRLVAVIVIVAVFECFAPDDAKFKLIIEVFAKTICVISVLSPISTAIISSVASIEISESFMLILLPVLTSIVSISGNPSLAISFQTISFAGAQIISSVAANVLVPIVGIVLSLDFAGTVMPVYNLSGITEFIKKSVNVFMSFASAIFVSFIGLKGALSNAVDTVTNKGIKLVISSAVPVVGGALSEAYNGIIGSMVLARSTLGVLGIGVMFLVNLPSCVQLLFWIFALKLSAAISELLEQKGVSALLRALSSSLTLLNVILVFVAVLFIISTALLTVIKAG